ncbi:MAG TPA: cytochrome c3 family protein, partial [Terriglobales bacterium]
MSKAPLGCSIRNSVLRILPLIGLVGMAWGTKQAKPQAAFPTGGSADASQYVRSDTCKTCHEDIFKNFETTRHFRTTLTKKGPQWQGCEACHGPGKAHVDGGGDKSKIFVFENAKGEDVTQRCLSCHEFDEEHANFE